MKIAVIDIQGYALPEEFMPKEITIKVGAKHGYFIFIYPYTHLSVKDRRIVNTIENKILGIRYSYGQIAYEELDSILRGSYRYSEIIVENIHNRLVKCLPQP